MADASFCNGQYIPGSTPYPTPLQKIHFLSLYPPCHPSLQQGENSVPVIFHIKSCIVGVHLIEYESLKVDASGKQRWRAIVKSFSNVNKS